MISVPASTASNDNSQAAPLAVSDEFLMMAAAQMHSEGRLVIPSADSPPQPQMPESK